jgi:RNA polymerase sigma-70 factor (ECF subfamily)
LPVEIGVEDKELIDRCLAGDERAWQQFAGKYQPGVKAYARGVLRSMRQPASDLDAEEIVGRVFEHIVEQKFRVLRAFRWQCTLATWLKILARTACVRIVRRKNLPAEKLARSDSSPSPLDQLLSDEAHAAVRQALEELPDRDRQVLTRFFQEGQPYEQIAAELDLPMGTVATILARTRARLREILTQKGISATRGGGSPGR